MFHSGSNIQAQKKNDLHVKYLCQSVLVTVIDSESFLLNVREFRAEASFQAWDGSSCTPFILPTPCGPKEATCVGEFILKHPESMSLRPRLGETF
jgi:hypothetical protein